MKHEKLLLSPQVLRNCFTSQYTGEIHASRRTFHFQFVFSRYSL